MRLSKILMKTSLSIAGAFLLVACTTSSLGLSTISSAPQTEDRSFSIYKQKTLDELGRFEFSRRVQIHETLDDLSRQLWRMRQRTVLKSSGTSTFPPNPVLQLIDIDGNGSADMFAYQATRGSLVSQDFGFVFDLNRDGKIDYLVFYQGSLVGKPRKNSQLPFEIVFTFYHWIDSDYDGKVDTYVYPDVDLDGDRLIDGGVYAWLHDLNSDGAIDKGEYAGTDFSKAIEIKDGKFKLQCLISQGVADRVQYLADKVLSDINKMMQ